MAKVSRLSQDTSWKYQDLGGVRPGKSVCVVRYGGFGDVIQTSSIFPELKRQGYSITLNTVPKGYEIAENDPHIDEIFIQEHGQVSNDELHDYWHKLESKFSRIIQLSECVEARLLAVPYQEKYKFSKEKRHELMNRNYLEEIHQIAEVPFIPEPKFYPTKSEQRWAKEQRDKLGRNKFVVLWSLSGSSVHKAWPYTDSVIANLMLKGAKVVTVGDGACTILEMGWEKEKNVLRKSGKWNIRKTLAFAETCDLVIGTETGVLNSVGHSDVAKIVMLSHSTKENLTKHWKNTVALEPEDCACYPCHQLHYSFKHCTRDLYTGGALCASNIGPDKAIAAIEQIMERVA